MNTISFSFAPQAFSRPYPVASSAASCAIGPIARVLRVIRMALFATSFVAIHGTHQGAPARVFTTSDQFQMAWTNTISATAEMVVFQPGRRLPNQVVMREPSTSFVPYTTIPVWSNRPAPQPAFAVNEKPTQKGQAAVESIQLRRHVFIIARDGGDVKA